MSSNNEILIVGAGPVGLVAALVLAQNNVPFRIVDKRASFTDIGQRGSALTPRSQEALHFLGVLPALRAAQGAAHDDIRVREYDAAGAPARALALLEKLPPTPTVPLPNPSMLGQDAHVRVLLAALAELGVEVELGVELAVLAQDADGVDVTLSKKGVQEARRFAHVLGADGAKGSTRRLAGVQLVGATSEEQRALVGDVYLFGVDAIHWHMFKDARGNGLVARPVPETPGLYGISLYGPDVDLDAAAGDAALLQRAIGDITKDPGVVLGEVNCLFVWRLNERMADAFRAGRVFLAGDAAHVHSPRGGQGLNSGLLDAVRPYPPLARVDFADAPQMNLAWKLALVSARRAPADLLDSYAAEREPVIRAMLRLTGALTRAPGGGLSARSRAITQLGVHCRWSGAVRDELADGAPVLEGELDAYGAADAGRLCAGDRAPDAPGLSGGEVARMFDLVRVTHHVVLVFDAALEGAVADFVRRLPKDSVKVVAIVESNSSASSAMPRLVDSEGHARRAYCTEQGVKIAVIRPDGVVGALLKGAEGLEAYFAKVLIL